MRRQKLRQGRNHIAGITLLQMDLDGQGLQIITAEQPIQPFLVGLAGIFHQPVHLGFGQVRPTAAQRGLVGHGPGMHDVQLAPLPLGQGGGQVQDQRIELGVGLLARIRVHRGKYACILLPLCRLDDPYRAGTLA